jgi:hypothetical protein
MFTFNRCKVNERPSMSRATTSSDGHVYWPAFTRIPMQETRNQGSRSSIHFLELGPQ